MKRAARTAIGTAVLAVATLATPAGANAAVNQGAAGTPTPSAPAASPSASPSAAAQQPSPSPSPSRRASGIKMRSYAYGRHPHQRMDVWWHPTGRPRPAIFLVHGGWWSGGSRLALTSLSRSYARLGYTVVNVDYRLSGVASWPAQRNDVITAIELVRKHARRFNTDANRYVVLGFSAGGHIAASVGTYGNGRPGLRGVVGISPVVSPLTAYSDGEDLFATAQQRRLRDAAVQLAGGCTPTECPDTWSSMEPAFHASPGDAPLFTAHSEREFVPPYQSELLKQALGEVGVPMTVKVVPGTGHSSAVYRHPGVSASVQAWIAARLGRR